MIRIIVLLFASSIYSISFMVDLPGTAPGS